MGFQETFICVRPRRARNPHGSAARIMPACKSKPGETTSTSPMPKGYETMKKTLSLGLALILILSLTACSVAKLSENYDKDEVLSRAEEIVALLNASDFDAVAAGVREDLQEQLSSEVLENALGEILAQAGAFQEFTAEAVTGQQSKTTGEDYAVAVLVGKYENASHTFTISFNEDLEIVGLYMK